MDSNSKSKPNPERSAKRSSAMMGESSRIPSLDQAFSPFDHEVKIPNHSESIPITDNAAMDWDPRVMLSNLSFLEQKIHQVQDIVRSVIDQEGQLNKSDELAVQKQQLVTADLSCIIIQLITTAGSLLPSIKNTLITSNPLVCQFGSTFCAPASLGLTGGNPIRNEVVVPKELMIRSSNGTGNEGEELIMQIDEHDSKESDDGVDGENLPPGSYVVLQLEKEEILAPHTHFCLICGKGFKRDANLRMHMRGHGDEYKTPAALAKPTRDPGSEPTAIIRRYSCPFAGCKRNKEHKKFQPLKTILCVKNHYKRSHCDKSYTCNRCNAKKFSVIADLKTHEKHCGRNKWHCSCGTTFSRKDKLFGHVALFQGHTPMLPLDNAGIPGTAEEEARSMAVGCDFTASGSSEDIPGLDFKCADDGRGYFSPMSFDQCSFGGIDEFTRPAFDVSDNPFSFLPPGSCNYTQRNGES